MYALGARRNLLLLSGIVLGAILGAGLIMGLLGSYLTKEYRALQLQSAADSGGLYVEGFLAPHAHEFFASGTLSDQSKEKLEVLLERLPVAGHFDVLKIWDLSGNLIFSTDGTVADEDEIATDLKLALAGEIVVELYADNDEHPNSPIQPPYLEIHAPIYDTMNREIIAIGEVYQDATGFLQRRAIVEQAIWGALGLSSFFGLSGLLLLVCLQRRTHMRHIAAISEIAAQNRELKESADTTRIEASQANEQLLNQIGAELHDGPIQMLSLMMLTLGSENSGGTPPPAMTPRELGQQVMSELRALSTGLVLPEIQKLSLEAALRLAATRHQEFTGKTVEQAFADLPETVDQGLKICCYRLVQEGLMNAHRHSDGSWQRVEAAVLDNSLAITVSDHGPIGLRPSETSTPPRDGIGLRGVRQRLVVFGGVLDSHQREGGGTVLEVRIPLK